MEERRVVTVLFCDIVGSTALASDADAEDWADVVRAVFPLMIDPVEKFGGTVARLMGDAVLAFFGAPTAREDDPQRAILAALDIQSGIQSKRDQLRRDHGFDINVRVGINTGLVVTGEFGSDAAREYTALGDTVNVAARMEQTAEPGTIQIAAETYRLARSYFEFQPLGLVEVKGKPKGIEAYRVLRRISDSEVARNPQEFSAPFVGRERELDLLRYRLRELEAGRGGVIAVTAEAGLGKSRLIEELRRDWLGCGNHARQCWVEDHLVSFEETTPYGLVQRRLAREFDASGGAALSVIEEHLDKTLTELDTRKRSRAIQAVDHLFESMRSDGSPSSSQGMDGAEDFRDELALVFEHIWRARLDRLGRCVYVVEDFHCIDASSAELLEQLTPKLIELPFLILLTFRPERQSPAWQVHERLSASLGIRYLTLALVRLVEQDSGALLDAMLPGAELPVSLRRMFLERIDGNPLFAEETVRSLIEHGHVRPYIESGEQCWEVAAGLDLAAVEIPTSLQALIQERVDMLDAGSRRTLQIASVVGRSFQYDELLEVLGDPAALDRDLRILQKAMLVQPDAYGGPASYTFQHALIWEAVYRSMLRRTLQRLHLDVGGALERLHFDRQDELAGILAQHFAVARDDRAIRYAERAGDHAQLLFAPQEAIEHYTRALHVAADLELTPSTRVLRKRGEAYEMRGSFDEARRDFDEALVLSRAIGDLRAEWETLVDIGRSWEGVNYDQAGVWFEQALVLARQSDDSRALGESLNRVGTWCVNTGRVDEGRAAHLEALAIFEALDDEPGIAATLDYLGVVADLIGDLREMRANYERAIEYFERQENLPALSSTFASMVAVSGAWVFETISSAFTIPADEAEAYGLRALQLAQEVGRPASEAYTMLNLAGLYLSIARYDDALHYSNRASEISSSIDHLEWWTAAQAVAASLYQELLAPDRALEPAEDSLRLARKSGSKHFILMTIGMLIEVVVATGQLERAGELLRTTTDELPMTTIGQRRVWAAYSSWALATGDDAAALRTLDCLLETALHVASQEDIPLFAWRRGLALIGLDRLAEAEDALLSAARRMHRLGWLGKIWRVQLDLARLYQSCGREAEASTAVRSAREIVDQLAPRIPDDEGLRANFLETAQAMFDTASDSTILRKRRASG